jgi:hypothetical protein
MSIARNSIQAKGVHHRRKQDSLESRHMGATLPRDTGDPPTSIVALKAVVMEALARVRINHRIHPTVRLMVDTVAVPRQVLAEVASPLRVSAVKILKAVVYHNTQHNLHLLTHSGAINLSHHKIKVRHLVTVHHKAINPTQVAAIIKEACLLNLDHGVKPRFHNPKRNLDPRLKLKKHAALNLNQVAITAARTTNQNQPKSSQKNQKKPLKLPPQRTSSTWAPNHPNNQLKQHSSHQLSILSLEV